MYGHICSRVIDTHKVTIPSCDNSAISLNQALKVVILMLTYGRGSV